MTRPYRLMDLVDDVMAILDACREPSAHCDQAMVLVVDSELNYRIEKGGPHPLVFEPAIEWDTFPDPTIIDGL